ncbi:MAG TPA: hypothetical protein VM869_35675, partial [Enhygromyxa sp.]|nr:hypothetical protein [Enhygromyxa sp.]
PPAIKNFIPDPAGSAPRHQELHPRPGRLGPPPSRTSSPTRPARPPWMKNLTADRAGEPWVTTWLESISAS